MGKYQDLGDLEEDKRIEEIVRRLTGSFRGKRIAICVDYEGGTKGDRYIKKIKRLCPGVVVLNRHKGPVKGVETILVMYH